MAGSPVDRNLLDAKMAEAIITLRQAFRKIETIKAYLANHPIPDNGAGVDPLMGEFGYDADDAYLIRLVFDDLDYARNNLNGTMINGRKLSGLE